MGRQKHSSSPVDIAFGESVYRERTARKWSQSDLAEKAGGMNAANIGWIETRHGCTIRTAHAIARALEMTIDALIGGNDNDA